MRLSPVISRPQALRVVTLTLRGGSSGGSSLVCFPNQSMILVAPPKVGDFTQLGDAQLDRAGARLPGPIAIAVALNESGLFP
jgi:hypothetical protein